MRDNEYHPYARENMTVSTSVNDSYLRQVEIAYMKLNMPREKYRTAEWKQLV